MQKRLKKFSLHAGQAEMMGSARLRLVVRASIWESQRGEDRIAVTAHAWSSSQQMGPSAQAAPQMPTSFSRVEALGSSARSLSGQGNCPPKKLCEPHWPRRAHRPGSCMSVQVVFFASDVVAKSAVAVAVTAHGQARRILTPGAHV